MTKFILLFACVLAGCASGKNLASSEILSRPTATEQSQVKQVLIAWDDCARAYKAGLDDAAKARTREQADVLVEQLMGDLQKGAPIDAMMAQYSSDKGAGVYDVAPDSPFEVKFIRLALRLRPDEVGVVKTHYGWHILKRVK